MKQLLEGLEGVEVIMDDMLVWGENNELHNERLIKLLERPYRNSLYWTSPE